MGSGKLWSGLKHELRLASSVNGAQHLSGHSTHVSWVPLMRLLRLRNSTIAFFTVPAAFLQGASTTRLGASALCPETKELCTCSGPSLLITSSCSHPNRKMSGDVTRLKHHACVT